MHPLKSARLAHGACRRLPLPTDFVISEHSEGLLFCFSLPSGAYATSLLREFMRTDEEPGAELEIDESA